MAEETFFQFLISPLSTLFFKKMIVNVIGTGSGGNLYELIDEQNNVLVIEAGLSVETFMKYKITKQPPEALIVSHAHSDHYEYHRDWSKYVNVELSPRELDLPSWGISSFDVKHGDIKNVAFIIESKAEDKKILFATDLEYDDEGLIDELANECRERDVRYFLLECNYNDYLYHLATSEQRIGCDRHFSDNDVVRFIRNAKPKAPRLILIHGSNRLCADSYTMNYIGKKLPNAIVKIAIGGKGGVKNIFKL